MVRPRLEHAGPRSLSQDRRRPDGRVDSFSADAGGLRPSGPGGGGKPKPLRGVAEPRRATAPVSGRGLPSGTGTLVPVHRDLEAVDAQETARAGAVGEIGRAS